MRVVTEKGESACTTISAPKPPRPPNNHAPKVKKRSLVNTAGSVARAAAGLAVPAAAGLAGLAWKLARPILVPDYSKKKKKDQKRFKVLMEDGIMLPEYRLPTEAEWEYAAYGLIMENPQRKFNKKSRGEEVISNKQIYAWKNEGFDNIRFVRKSNVQGAFMANFKRGAGDYMGVAGGLNDNAPYTSEVSSFAPNGFGLYNMSGNVSEWVYDIYRPMSNLDNDDLNPFRGNVFKQVDMSGGQGNLRDAKGRIQMKVEKDSTLRDRRNYQRSYAVNYMDGDTLSNAFYSYGITTLISDKSRVYKGGSWNDMAYWMSPGTRRFLDEDSATATIGFRCAMISAGTNK